MRTPQIKLKKMIFTRIMLIFLVIIIPIYGIGIGFYGWSLKTIREDQSKFLHSQAGFILRNLEDEINRIRRVQYGFTANEYLNQLLFFHDTMTDIQKLEVINNLHQLLDFIKNSSAIIQEVCIHMPDIKKTLSSSGGKRPIYNDINEEEYKSLKKGLQSNINEFCYWDGRMFLAVEYPVNSKSTCIISIEISKKVLDGLIERIYSGVNEIIILADTSTGNIVCGLSSVSGFSASDVFKKDKFESSGSGYTIMLLEMKRYIVVDFLSKGLGLSLHYYTSEDNYLKILNKFRYWFIIFTIFIIIVISLYTISTYMFIQKPVKKLVTAFGSVEQRKLDLHIEHKTDDEFGFLYFHFNEMMDNIKNLIDEVYSQKILAQKAQLKQLQSQINVHFLYNSYFMLHRLIKDYDYENAVLLSKHIGDYFQYITRNSMDDVILEKEVYHAKIYSDIQAMRFAGRIKVDFGELPAEYRNLPVPRLILQPIVENAFNHGLNNKVENGLIIIRFKKEDGSLVISVADNGDKLDNETIRILQENIVSQNSIETTGLTNVHRRINHVFGDKSGLFFSRSDIGGLEVRIVLRTKTHDTSDC